jgi:hypothetical protein
MIVVIWRCQCRSALFLMFRLLLGYQEMNKNAQQDGGAFRSGMRATLAFST